MLSIFNKYTKEALIEYLIECQTIININKDTAFNLAANAIKYYSGDKTVREILREFHELENRWYKSLEYNNKPDYSVYDDKYFLSDIWACWVVYSRKYLLALKSDKSLPTITGGSNSIINDIGDITNIIDLGCGFGYTTAGLKELFPRASVYGTNILGSPQYAIATKFGGEYNFTVLPDIYSSRKHKIDLVFASEYFEHIESPIDHLLEVLTILNPTYLIIANAFNSTAIGHFNKYLHENTQVDRKKISKLFNNTLRGYGYEKVKTNLWNSRPTYWRKNKENLNRFEL